MNDAMRHIQVVAACAIMVERGPAQAVHYLQFNDWTTNEAFELVALYEDFRQQIKDGRLT